MTASPVGAPVETRVAPRRRLHGARRAWLRDRAAWLFAAPSLLIIAVFIIWPIVQSFRYSLYDWTVGASEQQWVGLDNYVQLLHDDLFWNSLWVTLVFAVLSVSLQLVLGYAAASALQAETWLAKAVRSVYFFPTIVALATIGMVWRFLLDPSIGLVAGITKTFGGTPIGWLQDPDLALPTVIFVNVWKNVGFTMVILLAGLKGIPGHLYEAARIDGADGFRLTRHVTLPSLRPTLLLAGMMLTINSLQVFDLVYVMTTGGPLNRTDTLVNMLYREGFQYFNQGYASAIAWVLFLIILGASALQLRLMRYNDVD
ncbi:MAG: sugar ABC transporter permease [Propionibacteriaceae bacterium]|nr:sugar ABC transporter permease [Propionibacteriaceae bacterium]